MLLESACIIICCMHIFHTGLHIDCLSNKMSEFASGLIVLPIFLPEIKRFLFRWMFSHVHITCSVHCLMLLINKPYRDGIPNSGFIYLFIYSFLILKFSWSGKSGVLNPDRTIYSKLYSILAGFCTVAASSSWWCKCNNQREVSSSSSGHLWSAWLTGWCFSPLFLPLLYDGWPLIFNHCGLHLC